MALINVQPALWEVTEFQFSFMQKQRRRVRRDQGHYLFSTMLLSRLESLDFLRALYGIVYDSWNSAFQVPETGCGWFTGICEKSELVNVIVPSKVPAPLVPVSVPLQWPWPTKLALPHQNQMQMCTLPATF
jgi:hypothetical protein